MHPKYLDRIGLVALWREGLLAKKVIEGKTTGYKHHPQLTRFYGHENPSEGINEYLYEIWREANLRGYAFDSSKCAHYSAAKIPLTRGQLEYEYRHLMKKLEKREPNKHGELIKRDARRIKPHPLFKIVDGPVEAWEKI